MSNIGKYFEKKTQEALKSLQEKRPLYYYRFPDATSARNAFTAQPADHMIAYNGTVLLLEEKASDVHECLKSGASSLIKKKQAAMHTKWLRSGNKSIYLFYSSITGMVDIWDGEYVSKCRVSGKQLDGERGIITYGPIKDLESILLETIKL